jgi:hypothetical protein
MNDNHVYESAEPEREGGGNPFEQFVEHQKQAVDEATKALDALLPTAFKEHGKEAGRHFVKGFQVLVDAAITELEKANKEWEEKRAQGGNDRPSTTGPSKVKVQVD